MHDYMLSDLHNAILDVWLVAGLFGAVAGYLWTTHGVTALCEAYVYSDPEL